MGHGSTEAASRRTRRTVGDGAMGGWDRVATRSGHGRGDRWSARAAAAVVRGAAQHAGVPWTSWHSMYSGCAYRSQRNREAPGDRPGAVYVIGGARETATESVVPPSCICPHCAPQCDAPPARAPTAPRSLGGRRRHRRGGVPSRPMPGAGVRSTAAASALQACPAWWRTVRGIHVHACPAT